eukprot:TRINITY_DN49819_c0_g1_i1.p1 TRINITY_DN49819_c0_g1~~TRINITY_DN49819_c0_g1_i1.p1  ORF type:complete len:402 (+),score=38.76 TRINITY_DN49819_c0_g1_i1:40-1245(+)
MSDSDDDEWPDIPNPETTPAKGLHNQTPPEFLKDHCYQQSVKQHAEEADVIRPTGPYFIVQLSIDVLQVVASFGVAFALARVNRWLYAHFHQFTFHHVLPCTLGNWSTGGMSNITRIDGITLKRCTATEQLTQFLLSSDLSQTCCLKLVFEYPVEEPTIHSSEIGAAVANLTQLSCLKLHFTEEYTPFGWDEIDNLIGGFEFSGLDHFCLRVDCKRQHEAFATRLASDLPSATFLRTLCLSMRNEPLPFGKLVCMLLQLKMLHTVALDFARTEATGDDLAYLLREWLVQATAVCEFRLNMKQNRIKYCDIMNPLHDCLSSCPPCLGEGVIGLQSVDLGCLGSHKSDPPASHSHRFHVLEMDFSHNPWPVQPWASPLALWMRQHVACATLLVGDSEALLLSC